MSFQSRFNVPARFLLLAVASGLSACTINNALQGDKVDYKTKGAKTVSLEVPPDLTQLSPDQRYQPAGGTISASALQTAAPNSAAPTAAGSTANVAPKVVGEVTLERAGSQRWLATRQTPEELWPQLQAFWQERGFQLELEQRDTGLMETNWAENRAKLPQDVIRSTIGKVFDSVYDTGERDRFRTRLERSTDGGTEIYISHRGMVEVYTSERKDSTVWQPRPADPELEALMLSRLMLKIGGKEEQAKAAAAAASAAAVAPAPATARARLLAGIGTGLQVDEGFDRTWRRVGLALDRSGFTVEDRDRAQGLYYVRYVDPAQVGKDEPGFFGKLFGGGKKDAAAQGGLARYRIAVKSQQADSTLVTVLNNQGSSETGDAAQRILELLATDLK
ncbi:outer membrane protein assembly factor BamC [Methylibium sp.]|uniref:outer membrane protein assembly factor BamC n=1 Tax=Methylibium sp. TaxID=2067992 RepID=UPI003D14956C